MLMLRSAQDENLSCIAFRIRAAADIQTLAGVALLDRNKRRGRSFVIWNKANP